MGHSVERSGSHNARRHADSKDCASEISDGHQESIKTDSRGHILFWQRVCVSSAQVQKLCWRLTVEKAMTLVGELRRQLSLQVVAWLLLVTFSHVDSENWK